MLVIVHNILAPYRMPLFNEIGQRLGGQLAAVLTRDTYRKRRRWSVPGQDVSFQAEMLHTVGTARGERVFDVSFGIRRALDRLSPEMVVPGGWNLLNSWSSLRWCHRSAVPTVAWVEVGVATGSFRDPLSSLARRRFLGGCGAALMSGDGAVAFVSQLRPGLPTTVVRNAISLPALHALPAPTVGSAPFVGEVSRHKEVDVLLEALPGLPQHLERVVIVDDGQLTRGRGLSLAPGESSLPRILGRLHALWTRRVCRRRRGAEPQGPGAARRVEGARRRSAPRAGPGGWECQRSPSPLARGGERDGHSVRLRADRKCVQRARSRGHPGRPCRLHPELLCRGVPEGQRDRVAQRDVDPADRLRTT
jgi:hypothetical protein